ncbi:hypothetical protein SAMN06295912_1463 [Sphingomonas laterariae]|uniref:Uncharacterized protein n=2 Tax=Edaphosphingomonas laterariae TaxID=861865 RepID=A0A239K6I5_9SPHN|nr:hypothetical protein SAMN06295912_1463 [Sphingomonas laterariae]
MRMAMLMMLGFCLAAPAMAQDAAPAPAPAPQGDARTVATQTCMAEAEKRKIELGATAITLREVNDTDKKSDDVAGVEASVNVVKTDSKGKTKTSKKKFECATREGVVTKFEWK